MTYRTLEEKFLADFEALEKEGDELRRKADELRIMHVDDASVGTLFAAMGALREAADTIESLSDKLQDTEDARYDAGFSNGVKACLQQLDGLIHEGADVDEIQAWVDRQWEEEA